ncbi:MAG: hypothetical protein ACE145_08795 [Terriglobia bacterium]
MSKEYAGSTVRLILIPGLITLGVTILRLVGELQDWPEPFFSRDAGGGLAIVGISWLPVIFGIYFAWKLVKSGVGPTSLGKAFGYTALALVVLVAGLVLFGLSQFRGPMLALGCLLIAASALVPLLGWPALTKTLIAYGYAARIPVVIIMFFALRDKWGTHYDGPPPNFPEMGFLSKYFVLGVLPQLIGWIAFTVIVGMLFGSIAASVAGRRASEVPAA